MVERPRVLLLAVLASSDVKVLLEGIVGALLRPSPAALAEVASSRVVPVCASRASSPWSVQLLGVAAVVSSTDALPSCCSGGCFAVVVAQASSHADALLLRA
jgi:hypothetical protein